MVFFGNPNPERKFLDGKSWIFFSLSMTSIFGAKVFYLNQDFHGLLGHLERFFFERPNGDSKLLSWVYVEFSQFTVFYHSKTSKMVEFYQDKYHCPPFYDFLHQTWIKLLRVPQRIF